MTHIRALAGNRDERGRPEWLRVIHEANGVDPDIFGAPLETGDWWAGGTFERYADADVIHRGDGSVSLISTTARGSEALRQAADLLGIHYWGKEENNA